VGSNGECLKNRIPCAYTETVQSVYFIVTTRMRRTN